MAMMLQSCGPSCVSDSRLLMALLMACTLSDDSICLIRICRGKAGETSRAMTSQRRVAGPFLLRITQRDLIEMITEAVWSVSVVTNEDEPRPGSEEVWIIPRVPSCNKLHQSLTLPHQHKSRVSV